MPTDVTAPAQPTAAPDTAAPQAAVVVSAPATEAPPQEPARAGDILTRIASLVGAEGATEGEADADDPVLAADAPAASQADGDAGAAAQADAQPATEPEPAPLATQFAIYDADGDELDPASFAAVKVRFRADGKEREASGDQLVKLAQWGFHNAQLHQEVAETRSAQQRQGALLEQAAETIRALREREQRLLAEPEYWATEQERFAQQMSPEAQLAAYRDRDRRLADQHRQQEVQRYGYEAAREMATEITALQQQYPAVTDEEFLGAFNRLAAPYFRAGQIPPEHIREVTAVLRTALPQWAAERHEQRTSHASAARAQAEARARAAEEATLAARQAHADTKRVVARAVRPQGASAQGTAAREAPVIAPMQRAGDITNPDRIRALLSGAAVTQ